MFVEGRIKCAQCINKESPQQRHTAYDDLIMMPNAECEMQHEV